MISDEKQRPQWGCRSCVIVREVWRRGEGWGWEVVGFITEGRTKGNRTKRNWTKRNQTKRNRTKSFTSRTKSFYFKVFLSLDLEQRYFFFMAVFSDEQWIIIINQFISK